MKITKAQIKKIIKEELLKEIGMPTYSQGPTGDAYRRTRQGSSNTDSVLDGLVKIVRSWEPQTPEGEQYLEDVQQLLMAHGI